MAQQRFASDRNARLDEIRRIENGRHAWAANPPRTPAQWETLRREESRYARLTRSRRRTLAFRTRKTGTQTLEVDNNQRISVTPDRMSIWVGAGKDGFRVPLRRPLPGGTEVRTLRLVEKRRGRMQVRNRKLASVEYEAHISVLYAEAPPEASPNSVSDVVGVRVRKHWSTSEGVVYRNDGPHACSCRRQPFGSFRHVAKCSFARSRLLQRRIVAKLGGSARRRASKRRRKLERRRREVLRMRTADRDRVFTAHAQVLLKGRSRPVRMLAVESLSRRAMTASYGEGGLLLDRESGGRPLSTARWPRPPPGRRWPYWRGRPRSAAYPWPWSALKTVPSFAPAAEPTPGNYARVKRGSSAPPAAGKAMPTPTPARCSLSGPTGSR